MITIPLDQVHLKFNFNKLKDTKFQLNSVIIYGKKNILAIQSETCGLQCQFSKNGFLENTDHSLIELPLVQLVYLLIYSKLEVLW